MPVENAYKTTGSCELKENFIYVKDFWEALLPFSVLVLPRQVAFMLLAYALHLNPTFKQLLCMNRSKISTLIPPDRPACVRYPWKSFCKPGQTRPPLKLLPHCHQFCGRSPLSLMKYLSWQAGPWHSLLPWDKFWFYYWDWLLDWANISIWLS